MCLKKKEWMNKEENKEGNIAIGKEIKTLLENSEYQEKLSEIISDDLKLEIRGSRKLISEIIFFESELIKKDIVLSLKDVEFKGILDNSLAEEEGNDDELNENEEECTEERSKDNSIKELELKLLLGEKELVAESCYTVKAQYPELLELKSFYDACAKKKNKYENQGTTLEELRTSFFSTYSRNRDILGTKKNKYRIIEVEGKKYIRTIVGERYRDYNNLIATYISLYTLDRVARKNNELYTVESFSIKDSEIKVTFSGVKRKLIEGFGEISLDINLYNNELGKGSLILNVNYCIKSNGKVIRLNNESSSGEIKNRIFTISHSSKIETLLEKIEKGIKDTQEYEDELYELVGKIKDAKVTETFINKLLDEILNPKLQKLTKKTKEQVKKIEQTLKTTKDVLTLFGKINDLDMEFGEREYMSSIYYRILKQWKISE